MRIAEFLHIGLDSSNLICSTEKMNPDRIIIESRFVTLPTRKTASPVLNPFFAPVVDLLFQPPSLSRSENWHLKDSNSILWLLSSIASISKATRIRALLPR